MQRRWQLPKGVLRQRFAIKNLHALVVVLIPQWPAPGSTQTSMREGCQQRTVEVDGGVQGRRGVPRYDRDAPGR